MGDLDHIRQDAGRALAALGLGLFMALTFDEGLLPILLILGLVVLRPALQSARPDLLGPGAALAIAVAASAGGYALAAMEAPPRALLLAATFAALAAAAHPLRALWSTAPLAFLALVLPGLAGLLPALLALGLEARDLARTGRYAPKRDRDRISRTIWLAALAAITCLADPTFELRGAVSAIACPAEALACRAASLGALLDGSSYLDARAGTMDLALAVIAAQAAFVARLLDLWIMQQHGVRK